MGTNQPILPDQAAPGSTARLMPLWPAAGRSNRMLVRLPPPGAARGAPLPETAHARPAVRRSNFAFQSRQDSVCKPPGAGALIARCVWLSFLQGRTVARGKAAWGQISMKELKA